MSLWNNRVKKQELKAVLADIRVEPIESLAEVGAWAVRDSHAARHLQAARTKLDTELRSTAMGKDRDESGIPWRDGAAELHTRIEGLAAHVEGIRSKYFRNSEIVLTELAELLERSRTDLREHLEVFESQGDCDDPLSARLGFSGPPDDRETADGEHDEPLLKQIRPRILQRGERIAKELVRDARFDALMYVGDKDAARRIIDEELDELLS